MPPQRSASRSASARTHTCADAPTVIDLALPRTVARTAGSTNPIESVLTDHRKRAANVKPCQGRQMALRRCAVSVVEALRQFRHIDGHLHPLALRSNTISGPIGSGGGVMRGCRKELAATRRLAESGVPVPYQTADGHTQAGGHAFAGFPSRAMLRRVGHHADGNAVTLAGPRRLPHAGWGVTRRRVNHVALCDGLSGSKGRFGDSSHPTLVSKAGQCNRNLATRSRGSPREIRAKGSPASLVC